MNTEVDELEIDSVAPYQEDEIREELAALLSRLASLQGVAVPAHRFVYQQTADSGVSLDDMQQIDQAVAIWSQRFPDGPITKLNAEELTKADYPVVWMSDDGEKQRLLRGSQNGEYIAESSDWTVDNLSADEIATGRIVQLCSSGSKLAG